MGMGGQGVANPVWEGLIAEYLADLHRELAPISDGEVATYIPELAKADPNWFGLAIATVDGQVYVAGEVDTPFTIQSVSKPFMYGLALEELGRAATLKKVGVEPTGEAFNSTVLDIDNNRPFNPMVNAGAIAVSALVKGATYADRRKAMLDLFVRYAGREVMIDEATYQSECDTGDRNRAIAALMQQTNMMDGDVTEILDLYFSQCSVTVTCRDLAQMAAVLANGGVHPTSGVRAISSEYVHDVLTVMNSCGMYNYAGQWSYEVGIPAKSGVSGSIAAVIPGQIGIAAFSPRLDKFGNSVRAIAACKRIAEDFGLHVFRTPPNSTAAIRRELKGDVIRSKRARTGSERASLDKRAGQIHIIEAQGALYFGSAERLVRHATEASRTAKYIVIDFRRVFSADAAARALIERLAERLKGDGAKLIFAHVTREGNLSDLHAALLAKRPERRDDLFEDRDAALEWCENTLLAEDGAPAAPHDVVFSTIALFKGLQRHHLKELEKVARITAFEPGEVILKEGTAADRFFVIRRGAASVQLALPNSAAMRVVRIASLGVGATIGEMSLFDGGLRSADVIAEDHTVCYEFHTDALQKLAKKHPPILRAIYANLTSDLTTRLRAANREIRALEE